MELLRVRLLARRRRASVSSGVQKLPEVWPTTLNRTQMTRMRTFVRGIRGRQREGGSVEDLREHPVGLGILFHFPVIVGMVTQAYLHTESRKQPSWYLQACIFICQNGNRHPASVQISRVWVILPTFSPADSKTTDQTRSPQV
jgi:hypothetical protein